jgi:exosortase family protein XrtF
MKFSSTEKSILRFAGLFLGLIIGWFLLYDLVLHPWGKLDQLVINDCSRWSLFLLESIGYKTFMGNHPTIRTIGVDGTGGLWIGDPCDGLTLFAVFSFFVIAFPGKINHKLWFIPAGIILIHTMNIVRISLLCIVLVNHSDWLNFNHTYLFQVIMYGFVFLLWFIWIKKFSGFEMRPTKSN